MTQFCAFPGCDNPRSSKAGGGLCNSHYWQKHKGRELTTLSYRRDRCIPWLEAHVNYDGDDCLIWPFSTNEGGRGQVKVGKKNWLAPRYMCVLAHGQPPTPEHHAAHSCGKGHLGCVNPRHLRWATGVENAHDMIAHGTRPRGERQGSHKLTEVDVIAIRIHAMTRSQSDIGKQYGIGQSHVGRIVRRDKWSHI